MSETRAVQRKLPVPPELQGLRPAGAYTFDELYRLAQVCHASGLFEDITDAAQAMIKIVKGQELGLPPTTAMSAFDIIKKRLFIKPWAIAAKINACGYGAYRVVTQTPEQCTIIFSRKHPLHGWQDCPAVTYPFAEAKAHGLLERSPHWKASPAHMLYNRCMGRGGAMYFPELLAGIEPTVDLEPLPPARHAQNVIDLFGETHGSPFAPQEPREGGKESTRTIGASPGSESIVGQSGANQRVSSPQRETSSWRTLEAHVADEAVPAALRTAAEMLLEDADATEQQAFAVAGRILDYLDGKREAPDEAQTEIF